MFENQPLVSVLTVTYNQERFISDCIESILASYYTNFELIVVDDVSKDNTYQIAKKFESLDKRVKVYKNEINLGDYPNRNKAASYATGKYLKYVDGDDMIYKYSLSYMVEAMERFPEAGLGLSFNVIDDIKPYPQLLQPVDAFKEEFLGKKLLSIGPSSAIIKRDVFFELGQFSGKLFICDHEFWPKIASKYPIIKLQPSLVWWRIHDQQLNLLERKNIENRNVRFQLDNLILEENKHFLSIEEYKIAKNRLYQNYARSLINILLKKGNVKAFLKLYKLSNLNLKQLFSGFKGYI